MTPTIAVLAVQGAFIEHEQRLQQLGCHAIELRQADDLRRPFDGLVLPGGESTAQAKLLRDLGMFELLRQRISAGLPVLGTCAGLILLAEHVEGTGDLRGLDAEEARGRTTVGGFRTLPVTVRRNAYGRQLGSFRAFGTLSAERTPGVGAGTDAGERAGARGAMRASDAGEGAFSIDAIPSGGNAPAISDNVPLTFIRAPRIEAMEAGVETLVAHEGHPVAVRLGNQIGAAFHPELDQDNRLYEAFLALVRAAML